MQQHNRDNIGTFHTLYVAKVKDLTSVNFDVQKFEEIYFTPQTGQWQRKTKSSKNGNYFEHNLVFDVPKYRDDVETTILDYVRVGLIAYIVLTNGESVRIGSFQSPLFILVDTEAGKNYADFNSYAFKGTATEAINMTKNAAIVVTPPLIIPEASGIRCFRNPSNHIYIENTNLTLNPLSQSLSIVFRGNLDFCTFYLTYQSFLTIYVTGNNFVCFQNSPGYGLRYNYYPHIMNPTQKYHFVITRDNGQEKVYVDGSLIGTNVYGTGGYNNYMQFYLSSESGSNVSSGGEIYDLKGFNRVLTPSEVLIAGNSGNTNLNPIFHIPFTEKTGNIAYDISGNNNHFNLGYSYDGSLNLGPNNSHISDNGLAILG
jgi:hypothetical protein